MSPSGPTLRDELAERLRSILSVRPSVREIAMFGGIAFMVDDRLAVAAMRDGVLLVHIVPSDYDSHLTRGAEPAYMGRERPMGPGWLTVSPNQLENDVALSFWVDVGVSSGGGTPR